MADALVSLASMYKVNTWNELPRIAVQHFDRPDHVFAADGVVDEKP